LVAALATQPRVLRRPHEATAAAHALGRLAMRDVEAARSPDVTRALLAALQRPDVGLQRGAAFALARQGPTMLAAPLSASLQAATAAVSDANARAFLVRAVANAGDPADPLLAALSTDPSPGVRIAVARAAARLGWSDLEPLLMDEEVAVQLEAIAAIGTISQLDRAALLQPILDAGSTLEAAEAWRASADPALHRAAAALDALGRAGLLENAAELVETTRPTRIRQSAVPFLDTPSAWQRLALKDGEGSVRTAAARALAASAPSRTALHALLDAFDPMVGAIAAEALIERPARENEAPLLETLAHADDASLLANGLDALATLYGGASPKVRKPDRAARRLAEAHVAHRSGQVRAAAGALMTALGGNPPEPWH
ncbi:MAG: hypothetical protein VX000_02580, partial [Myxococcota bacterium]|nr:hypothetical protein [Myxococcota bacterium]